MAAREYVVAVRRDKRGQVPADWARQIGEIDGVSVLGSSERRAQVSADEAGLDALRQHFGSEMLIEPVIPHHLEDEPGPA
jgi:hypothetical protein